jgi:hypothetical protein
MELNIPDLHNKEAWKEFFKREDVVDYPIVFIHGIAGSNSDWQSLVQTLSDNYCEISYGSNKDILHNFTVPHTPSLWLLSYYTKNLFKELLSGDLTLYSLRLKAMIDKVMELTGKNRVIIIAHSMGGLVARKYMTLDENTWQSVYKILTIATPHNGIDLPTGFLGHFKDMQMNSEFLKTMNAEWNHYESSSRKKWGVIGSIDKHSVLNFFKNSANKTDSGGLGFVSISSVIPYNEWQESVEENMGREFLDTQHFGFRMALYENHVELLHSEGTLKGILWAIQYK